MMTAFYVKGLEFRLLALDEYEAAGGSYFDGQDEEGPVEPQDFVAALAVPERDLEGDELPLDDACRLAGLNSEDYWQDARTGWTLIRDWPEEARMVGA